MYASTVLQEKKPVLGLIFPLVQEKDKVRLSQDVWVCTNTVLPKGTQLRTIFTPPKPGDADVSRIESKNKFFQATAQERGLNKIKNSTEAAFELRAEHTHWKDIGKFRAMLQFIENQREEAYIVYQLPGDKQNYRTLLSPPEGTLWTEQQGRIMAIWVRPGSRSDQLGVKPGDLLLAVNNKKVNNLFEADRIWHQHPSEPTFNKTWLIQREQTQYQIDFGKHFTLQTSAVDAW